MNVHETHVAIKFNGENYSCKRCNMCTCHSNHKMITECERIDGRVKV